jgi:hypothetical protein
MEYLGLYNKPKAAVPLGRKLTGPKEAEQQQQMHQLFIQLINYVW